MFFTRKKITTIVDELTTFFFAVGSDDMVVKIKQTSEGFQIFFDPPSLPRILIFGSSKNTGQSPVFFDCL